MNDAERPRKSEIRTQMRTRLAKMNPSERHDAAAAACRQLATLEIFRHSGVVMLYMPLADELDLTPIAISCFQAGKTVCVPRVDWKRRDMEPVEVTSFDDHVMDTDSHGLRTPRGGAPLPANLIDLVVVPGLAFDTHGFRLGRGGGYYDRFLARLRRSATSVGLVFDIQIIDSVPVDDRDVTVDIIVTDRRVTRANGSHARR